MQLPIFAKVNLAVGQGYQQLDEVLNAAINYSNATSEVVEPNDRQAASDLRDWAQVLEIFRTADYSDRTLNLSIFGTIEGVMNFNEEAEDIDMTVDKILEIMENFFAKVANKYNLVIDNPLAKTSINYSYSKKSSIVIAGILEDDFRKRLENIVFNLIYR